MGKVLRSGLAAFGLCGVCCSLAASCGETTLVFFIDDWGDGGGGAGGAGCQNAGGGGGSAGDADAGAGSDLCDASDEGRT
jgi:hypothetical protein